MIPPINNAQDAAGFAETIGGLVEEAKKHAHQAIEDLGPAVDTEDAEYVDSAVLSIVRTLNALTCMEDNLAEVTEAATVVPKAASATGNAEAHATLEAPVGPVTGQLDDLQAALEQAAGWCGADSAGEAQSHVLAAFVSLGRLRESLGFRTTTIRATGGEAPHG